MTSRIKNSPISPFSGVPTLKRTESVPLPERFVDCLERTGSAPADLALPTLALKPPIRQASPPLPTLSHMPEPGRYMLNYAGSTYFIKLNPPNGSISDCRLAGMFSSLVDLAMADKPDFRQVRFARDTQ